jgi:hypothetical protein
MVNFRKELIDFNMRLRSSLHDLTRAHEHVSPHWQDEMRRHYDAQWEPLREMLQHYDQHEGRDYVEFLSHKMHKLEGYLFGG